MNQSAFRAPRELAEEAAQVELPEGGGGVDEAADRSMEPVGRPVGPVHAEAVGRGQAVYGLDLSWPDLLVAVVERAPVHGGRVRAYENTAARAVEGVVDVVEVEPRAG